MAAGAGPTRPRRTASCAVTSARRVSTGRPAATRRSPWTPRATPTCLASCSTGAAASPRTRTSSGFFVFRSTGNGGASWNFPGRPVATLNDADRCRQRPLRQGVDDCRQPLGQPVPDRIYVSWTTFAADGTAYIYEEHSNDYGESFCAPVLVSGDNPALCEQHLRAADPAGPCNENQILGRSSRLTARCMSSTATSTTRSAAPRIATGTAGQARLTAARASPRRSRWANYYELPDCDTYQGAGADPGRACVPEKGADLQLGIPRHQLPDRPGRPDQQ